ncbi:transmembrane protein 254-like isoform X1 [Xenia sp. Carnegie-2017]|uniref:transmembrane protein 254-like isoform X1 n=1 Tax=Xenia sp. Carnegie-2017 TaxID=2897299 RepID=UPI001F034C9E|nr:transmembrane protein 254-like isoform X1 [Xenia sp. Carnegie-2017]
MKMKIIMKHLVHHEISLLSAKSIYSRRAAKLVLSFFPKVLPCQQLGEMGDVFCYYVKEYNYLIKVVYIAVIAIHVLESLYSWVLSSNLGCSLWDQMKWFLQTFIVGYFSLSIIRKMNNEQMKRKH